MLFIDEAYSLVHGKDDMYGHQAVDTLLDDARSSGLIAGAIQRAGLSGVDVALPRAEQKR